MSKFDVPIPNTLIPQDLSLLSKNDLPSKVPNLLKVGSADLWYKKDDKFQIPKAFFSLNYITSELNFGRTLRSVVFRAIWFEVLEEHLREYKYMA